METFRLGDCADSGFADSGVEVIVVGLDAFGLIVDKPEPQES